MKLIQLAVWIGLTWASHIASPDPSLLFGQIVVCFVGTYWLTVIVAEWPWRARVLIQKVKRGLGVSR